MRLLVVVSGREKNHCRGWYHEEPGTAPRSKTKKKKLQVLPFAVVAVSAPMNAVVGVAMIAGHVVTIRKKKKRRRTMMKRMVVVETDGISGGSALILPAVLASIGMTLAGQHSWERDWHLVAISLPLDEIFRI